MMENDAGVSIAKLIKSVFFPLCVLSHFKLHRKLSLKEKNKPLTASLQSNL